MKRRAALQLLAALAAGQAVPPGVLEEILSGAAPDFDGRADVADWDKVVWEYAQLVPIRPVGSLVGDLTADIITVGGLLERRHAPMVHAGLLRVSAGLSWILAAQFDDVGDRRAARLTWQTSRRAADDSGDLDLRVWVRSKEASMARWSDLPGTVADALADEAIALSGGKPSRGLAQAYSVRAALAARRGDARDARQALGDLADVMEHLEWARYFALSQAYVYSLMGDRRADMAIQSARPFGPDHPHLQMIQAIDLIRCRDIHEGLQLATSVIRDRPVSAARYLASEIIASLPAKARTLPAARELRTLAGAASR